MKSALKFFLVPFFAIVASTGHAYPEDSGLQREIALLRRVINNNVSYEQRNILNRAVDRLEMSAERVCRSTPYPPPYPAPYPPPTNPYPNPNRQTCDIEFDTGLRAYRTTKDGSPLSSWAYNLNDVLKNIGELQSAGICRPSRDSVCDLEWDSGLRAYRTVRNSLPFQSYQYDLNSSLSMIQNLKEKGLCRSINATRCDLDWDTGLRAYRVSRNGSPASSWAYDQTQTIALMEQLRDAGLCY